VAEEGSAPHAGEDWSSIQSLPREVRIDPTNETRLMFPAIPELEALRGAAHKPWGDAWALLGLLRQEGGCPVASLAAVCDGSPRIALR